MGSSGADAAGDAGDGGSPNYNFRLSEQRATSCRYFSVARLQRLQLISNVTAGSSWPVPAVQVDGRELAAAAGDAPSSESWFFSV